MRVREATDDDWPQIYAFWRTIVDDGETDAFPPDASSEEARAIWVRESPGATVVAVEEQAYGAEVVLGSANMGPNRPGRGSHVGTASFMVSPEARGRSVGRRLGEHVVAWHREEGYAAIQFNAVVETNEVAVRLWRSLGFAVVGTVPEAFDSRRHGLVGLYVMHLPLG